MSQVTKMEWKEKLIDIVDAGGDISYPDAVEFIENLLTLSESRVRGKAESLIPWKMIINPLEDTETAVSKKRGWNECVERMREKHESSLTKKEGEGK